MKTKNPGTLFYVMCIINFYVVPFFIKDTSSAIFILMVLMPLICLVTSVAYGIKNGLRARYFILITLLFIPSLFIYYNATAWIYVVLFGGISLIGDAIGGAIKKRI